MILIPPSKIFVANSPIHGLGVFAKEFIKQGEIIETCPVIDIGLTLGEPSPILIDYRFNWPQGTPHYTNQVICSGYGMLYNHRDDANANWRSNIDINSFEFYALKDIRPNEEIFVWYGDISYWNDGRNRIEVK